MYLKRKIDEYLLEWKKNEERLPLIIKGARQIGKTESINHFAEQNYSNIVSINFVLEPKYKTILSDGYAVEDIIKNISMIDTSKRFIAGDRDFISAFLQEENYRREFTDALRDYVSMGNSKYAIYTDKIYQSIFREKAQGTCRA